MRACAHERVEEREKEIIIRGRVVEGRVCEEVEVGGVRGETFFVNGAPHPFWRARTLAELKLASCRIFSVSAYVDMNRN